MLYVGQREQANSTLTISQLHEEYGLITGLI